GSDYAISQSTGAAIVPGTTDSGNHCDNCVTSITLPFTYTLYGQPFASANVSSNGNVQFSSGAIDSSNLCLPYSSFNYAILPHWDDLTTAVTGSVPSGIYTSVSGVTPNRIFNLEWRAVYVGSITSINFEVRLYEGQNRFDI